MAFLLGLKPSGGKCKGKEMGKIKNIIFDLGGVIINLDLNKTIKAFESFGISNFSNTYNQLAQTPLFDQFDKGLISEVEFFTELKKQFNLRQSILEMENAWNSMLLDFPSYRLQELSAYKKQYRTFLLSNTNETHITEFEKRLLQNHSINNLSSFFEKDYYSCRLKMRKPDKEIFEFVLNENGLLPSETVFIDDTIIHIEGAKKTGVHTILLPKGKEFKEALDALLT